MIRKTVISVFVCTTLMVMMLTAACTVRGPSVKVRVPGVEVGVEGNSTHCPPGQAKKGRC